MKVSNHALDPPHKVKKSVMDYFKSDMSPCNKEVLGFITWLENNMAQEISVRT